MLAFRQWAEEAPSAQLARQLKQDPDWQRAVDFVRLLREIDELSQRIAVMHDRPATEIRHRLAGENAPLLNTLWLMLEDDLHLGPVLLRNDVVVGSMLREYGLLDSPSVIAHLRAVAAGNAARVLPARGALVTTLVYGTVDDTDATAPAVFHDGAPDMSIACPLAHRSVKLLRQAERIAARHGDWLENFRRHPFRDPRKVAQALANGAETLEYLDEALDPRHLERLRKSLRRPGADAETVIAKHLTRCYHKVYNLRRRHGLPTVVDPGWRDVARARLRTALSLPPTPR